MEVLRHHAEAQVEHRAIMREAYQDQGTVFANARGGWTSPRTVQTAIRPLARSAGHEGITVRSLRHFHASVALQTGQNIVVVSKRLGHASVSVTSGHLRPRPPRLAEASRRSLRPGDGGGVRPPEQGCFQCY